jgi:Flp pilus assembly protein TadG
VSKGFRNSLKSSVRSFPSNERGNVALMFGLTSMMLMAGVGVAVDYSQQSTETTKMWAASDAAALAAAKQVSLPWDKRKALAEKEYFAYLEAQGVPIGEAGKVKVTKEGEYGVRVEGTRTIDNSIMGLFGQPKANLKASAVANYGAGRDVEIALVLDNTGSMADDMGSLRDAASSFTTLVFKAATKSDAVKVALVPFTASVNVGPLNLSMSHLDTGANGKHHGQGLENRQAGFVSECNWGPPGPPYTPPDPGNGGKGVFLADPLKNFADAAREVLGVKPALASAVVTPGTDLSTVTGVSKVLNPPQVYSTVTTFVPTGYVQNHPCTYQNPEKISHFDLFNRINGAKWKGCVEARPEPFDVTDATPGNGDPNTLFVPYFWPDENDFGGGLTYPASENNYMADGTGPAGFSIESSWERTSTLFKYNTKNPANIVEVAPDTSGPNKGCGQALTPLTSDQAKISGEIAKMRHWNGGGTIASEGLMWGWRALSPEAPLTEGQPYDKVKKYLVLMTDGDNIIGAADKNGPVLSHYSAYGYLRFGRFPAETYAAQTAYLNQRMEAACSNIKQTGIVVMTVLFRTTTPSVIDRMRQCASTPQLAYMASDAASLKTAFEAVAAEVTRLRLTK